MVMDSEVKKICIKNVMVVYSLNQQMVPNDIYKDKGCSATFGPE